MREESHLDDMRSAIRGDFERLAKRRGGQELMRDGESAPPADADDNAPHEIEGDEGLQQSVASEVVPDDDAAPEPLEDGDAGEDPEAAEGSQQSVASGDAEPARRGWLDRLLGRGPQV